MKASILLFPILGLVAGTALAQSSTAQPMEPSKAAELLMSNKDSTFMKNAASAGMFEVEASKVAQQKATDPKLKEFAQKMIDDHTKANDELKSLASSKNITLPTTLAKHQQMMLDHLNKEQQGKDFDEAYRHEMLVSHKEAISLFDNAARNAKDPEVKSWAAQTLPTLKEHGGRAKALNKTA